MGWIFRLPLGQGVTLLSLFVAFHALSATHITSASVQSEIEQQQRAQLEEAARQREDVARPITLPKPSPSGEVEATGPCFEVTTIRFEGSSVLDENAQATLSQPYLHRCMGLAQINALIRDVSQWYLAQGYITSRAYLPEQDLAGGRLTIGALEGRIEAFRVNGEPDPVTRTLFPGLVGQILNLRDLEQGVDQLSRLRSLAYQLDIQPGKAPGQSVVNLKGSRNLPVQGSLGFDNSGQQSTGEEQGQLSLSLDNLLSLADQWTLMAGSSTDERASHNATNWQVGMSQPYGYWLFEAGYQYSDYRNDLQSRGYVYETRGDTRTTTGTLTRTLYRDGESKFSGVVGVTHRRSRNFVLDQLLESSSYQLSSLRLGLNMATRWNRHFFTLNPALTLGTDWFGADRDAGRVDTFPKAQFQKWGLFGSYSTGNGRWGWLTTGALQWSPDTLYSVERISLGGEASVRGFKEQSISGDTGGYLRNELSLQGDSPDWLGQWKGWLALDMGRLDMGNQGDSWRGMVGTAIGWEQRYHHFTGGVSLGIPLSAPGWLNADPWVLYYRASVPF